MAIFHQTVKIISRAKGQNAVASASYRSGEKLRDCVNGQTHDYTRKSGIVHTEILTPKPAPEWTSDREKLWNAIEASEKRKDAQLAREIEVALPVELDREKQIGLVRGFVKENLVKEGMIADVAIHDKGDGNPHAHIMLTMRDLTPEGFGKKNRGWNDTGFVEKWRDGWESHVNATLALEGIEARVDRRTLEAQGIERTPQVHVGKSPHRAEANEQIKLDNATAEALLRELAEINVRLPEIERDIEREPAAPMDGEDPDQAPASEREAETQRRLRELEASGDLPNLAPRTPAEAPSSSEAIRSTPKGGETQTGPSTRVSRPKKRRDDISLEELERFRNGVYEARDTMALKIAKPDIATLEERSRPQRELLEAKKKAAEAARKEIEDNPPGTDILDRIAVTNAIFGFFGQSLDQKNERWGKSLDRAIKLEKEANDALNGHDELIKAERERIQGVAKDEAAKRMPPELARDLAEAERRIEEIREREAKARQKADYERRMALKAKLEQQEADRQNRRGRGVSR
jgi:hypothetical protein